MPTSAAAGKKQPKKIPESSARLGIPDKDQKLLWGRAAGRCSFETCRVEVTLDTAAKPRRKAQAATPPGSATVGEMGHIVGYKPGSARSKSPLTREQRNRYANLILLCAHHHAEVDADEGRYPVEVLHEIKASHEEWVRDTLSAVTPDPETLVHADLVDTLTVALQLERWPWFVDHAVRDLVHHDVVDGNAALQLKVAAAIWPATKPELTRAIQDVAEAANAYFGHFLSGAELRPDNFFGPDLSYKRYVNPRYHEAAEKRERWSQLGFALLYRYTATLNLYADVVRRTLNPMYFRLRGRFLVVDDGGMRLGVSGFVDPSPDEAEGLVKRFSQ